MAQSRLSSTQAVRIAPTLVCAMMTACASGGGSGPSPSPTPTPTPAPTPTPTSFTFSNQSYTINEGNSGIQQDPVTVTITDNNAASSFGAIQFNGAQTVQVQVTEATGVYSQTFTTSDYKGNSPQIDPRTGISASAGTVALSSWEAAAVGGSSLDDFYIFKLMKTVGGVNSTPSYVSLADFASTAQLGTAQAPCSLGCYQLLGAQTPVGSMPTAGTGTFNGQAFGQFYPSALGQGGSNSSTPFLATATMTVDFSQTTNAISGTISNLAQSSASDTLRFNMAFTASLSGSSFSGAATAVDASGGTAITTAIKNSSPSTTYSLAGNIQGGFYGPATSAASETGGTFALVGPQYKTLAFPVMVGGFVAGR